MPAHAEAVPVTYGGDSSSFSCDVQTLPQVVTLTPEDLEQASKYAIQVGKEISSYSKLADSRDEIPLLERDEVILGALLGTGGFNSVYEVHAIELFDDNDDENNDDVDVNASKTRRDLKMTPPQILARRLLAKQSSGGSLAVKFLSESCKTSSQDYANGAADLLLETQYLSALSSYPHANIIRLHGVAAAGPEGFATGAEGAYFLILDRLADTLDGRIEVWKELERRKMANLSPEFELHLKAMFVKQLQVGVDLASALAHLHKLRIIFRDLKVRCYFSANGANSLLRHVVHAKWLLAIELAIVFIPTHPLNLTISPSPYYMYIYIYIYIYINDTARKYRIRFQGGVEIV